MWSKYCTIKRSELIVWKYWIVWEMFRKLFVRNLWKQTKDILNYSDAFQKHSRFKSFLKNVPVASKSNRIPCFPKLQRFPCFLISSSTQDRPIFHEGLCFVVPIAFEYCPTVGLRHVLDELRLHLLKVEVSTSDLLARKGELEHSYLVNIQIP